MELFTVIGAITPISQRFARARVAQLVADTREQVRGAGYTSATHIALLSHNITTRLALHEPCRLCLSYQSLHRNVRLTTGTSAVNYWVDL
jgi:hypothetical protein